LSPLQTCKKRPAFEPQERSLAVSISPEKEHNHGIGFTAKHEAPAHRTTDQTKRIHVESPGGPGVVRREPSFLAARPFSAQRYFLRWLFI
jgi:hypothetical protein